MARQKKTIETPGQETTQPQDTTGAALNAETTEPTVRQNVATLLGATALAERNAILATLNAQGATIVARFEELGFTDLTDQNLTDNLEFLTLVRKATDATNGSAGAMVTNEEGKPQPVRGAPVLTEHGWHVPG
ncbi:hypothetical protein HMPREF0484_3553 [Klebsiella pneumoniae subsp. rhinoscleromatis ATCC 13884]|uniref:hypothetical protein n=1 Tax=Klebsiella pneumoniae TaxID=573 RepID=UPI0001B74118|nr:hypothetical protein [Klebsiella pneumoniae]EEW40382.1 hypothetical protein HMPREF0484_3553 [Klebsiella pneumoniae subsp. rhinoscleromatis ATCC 13884]STT67331.1 Uncharacterised protein [Klebsiella pneumoniae]STV76983.1 Uncharacterised protein [Klebsiella pneumoniae subsp. rhinoscleromatis]VTT32983.1 Uncharacterised protein [Klebsiella pneumoniae]